ncbi:MAG: hypothetical protein R2838_02860 [Caldilineaceae bacterium]
MLTVAYMALSWWERAGSHRQSSSVASRRWSPVLIYNGVMLKPTSPEAFAQAQSIIVNERIPQHCCWTSGWTTRSTSRGIGGVGAVSGAAQSVVRHHADPVRLCRGGHAVAGGLASDAIAFLAPWRLVFPVLPRA